MDTDNPTGYHEQLIASLPPDPQVVHANIAHALSLMATDKDIPWSKLLAEHPVEATAALEREITSLEKHILRKVRPGDPEYDRAVKESCSGRYLGARRRDEAIKARGVKQGFKENLAYM